MSGPQQQGFVMHPYFGLIPAQHAAAAYMPPQAPYGAYGAPTGGLAGSCKPICASPHLLLTVPA